ncbi:hypothetical protein ABIE78_005244 [Sinorhizobium fredii]|jgi:hypothetical protein|uniref:hypothetical protein n=1 Tax=Rhizobium fredii TaxID=380 RepID=UPI0002D2B963|nr:hypothetical protein [Sinorhizobium fredii]
MTALATGSALGPFQVLEQGLETLVALSFRVHLKLTQRSADVQIMVAHIRCVPGDLCHRFEYMSRRDFHFLPEELCFPENAKLWRRFLLSWVGSQLRIDFSSFR